MADEQTLLSALLAFQKDAQGLKLGKDAEGQAGSRKYKYLTLHTLHEAVMPLLTKHGLVWITKPEHDGLVYRLKHTSGQEIEGGMPLHGVHDMQTLGSAITYARRYALVSVLGLVADEDDDGAAASKPKPPTPIRAVEQPTKKEARLLNDEEEANMLAAIKRSGQDLTMVYNAAGIEPDSKVNVDQARKVRDLIA